MIVWLVGSALAQDTGPCAGPDADGDGVGDDCDGCPSVFDPDQADTDGDGVGDACDAGPGDTGDTGDTSDTGDAPRDSDGDGVIDDQDPCPTGGAFADIDGDGLFDGCFECRTPTGIDTDGDTWDDTCDNCPSTPNLAQLDHDYDGLGDDCDPYQWNCRTDGPMTSSFAALVVPLWLLRRRRRRA